MSVAADGSTEANNYFCIAKMQTIPHGSTNKWPPKRAMSLSLSVILSEVEQIRKDLCNEVEGSVPYRREKRILRLRCAPLRMTLFS